VIFVAGSVFVSPHLSLYTVVSCQFFFHISRIRHFRRHCSTYFWPPWNGRCSQTCSR